MKFEIKDLIARFLGFSIVGGAVTLVSMLVIFVLAELFGVDINIAYIVSYVLSIQLSYFLNLKYVFNSLFSFKNFFFFNLTYLAGMLLGVGILNMFVKLAPLINKTLLSFAVIPITLVFNFFFVNLITRKRVK